MFSNGIFYSASDYYKEIYGCKAYKISLDAGCTCPNRDGTKGSGGCIFCSSSGSGDFAASRFKSISDQVEEGKLLVKDKVKAGKFIAYFQNFTSTYGNPERLLSIFNQAVENDSVSGLAVATRPDCLNEQILKGLAEISLEYPVSIELGFQTSKNESVNYIRRCYENHVLNDAVCEIRKLCPKSHIVTHLIFGLPGETKIDMLNSLKYVLDAGTDGIKIALLHVLKNTDLAKDYFEDKFRCLEMDEYFEILSEALKVIPENIVVHRLTGDGAKKDLIAPLWTENKKHVYNSMIRYFKDHGVVQGCKLK